MGNVLAIYAFIGARPSAIYALIGARILVMYAFIGARISIVYAFISARISTVYAFIGARICLHPGSMEGIYGRNIIHQLNLKRCRRIIEA